MMLDQTTSPAELADATPLLDDPPALRAQAERDGYLFFRGLLPPEDVLQVRADLLAVVGRFGWRAAGRAADPLDGTLDLAALRSAPASDLRDDIGVTHAMYHAVQHLESMHALPHHPRLVALYEALFAGPVLVHPRHIVRMITPHPAMVPTPVHQDFPLIQGTAHTWTCWIPAGDCPRDLGGLAVLRASHHHGCLPIQPASGAGSIAAQLCPGENDWRTADYRAGDVLTFPSYTVHKGTPGRQKDQIRLSLDVRYQPAREPVEAKSLLPHCALTWEDIYKEWKREDLQYYWRRRPLEMSPWNDALLVPGRRIC